MIEPHDHNKTNSPPVKYSNLAGVAPVGQVASSSLSSAQIKALHTTPIVLLKGLKGHLIIVEAITATIVYSGTAYTGSNNLEFRYTDGSGTKVTADIPNSFINSSSTSYYHAPLVTSAFVPTLGASIVVVVPTANPAAGNSVITLMIKYRII